MKIAILLGRGTEGCGVTQCALQLQKVTRAKIFSAKDKKWPRAKGIDIDQIEFSVGKAWLEHADIINTYDLCIVYSVPSKGHPEDCQENFIKMLKAINIRKAFINVDHKPASIARNANLKEVCELVDVMMTHSLNNAFTKFVQKNNITVPVVKMGLGFDYDAHRAKYWKPIEEQNSAMVRWIGRTSGWKGPELMMDFHEESLMNNGFITVLEGLEASIAYRSMIYRDKAYTERRALMNYFRPEKEYNETKFTPDLYGKEELNKGAYLYPPYTNVDAMERMSLSAFGSDLYHLEAEIYGNNIENCHAECIASGTVPLFHKHFCDHVIHKVQGKPISQCINTGTIGLDYSNFDETQKLMTQLKDDNVMRNEWREMAFEFWKQHSDAKPVVDEILKLATETQQTEINQGLEEFFV